MGVRVDYKNKVVVDDLDTIYITGGGFVRRAFKGIARESAWGFEKPVFGGNLNRTVGDFAFSNILDVDYGLVANCNISFKYMNAQDYFDLCELSKQRVLQVDYFNREKGIRVEQEMAFTENEIDKLYSSGKNYLGVFGFSIKLVATNRDLARLVNLEPTITYLSNGGTIGGGGSLPVQKTGWGDNVHTYGATIVDGGNTYTLTRAGYTLVGWATKNSKGEFDRFYNANSPLTVWADMILHAQWEAN